MSNTSRADAARVVSNHHLDNACRKFGDDLFLAVDKDRTRPRWLQFFLVPVGQFIRQALAKQVARVRGWLGSKDPVLEKHRDPLDPWSTTAAGALEKTNGVALVRGDASIGREQMAEDLTHERDGLHDTLSARAREKGLSRDWPDLFSRTQGRNQPDEPEAPEDPFLPADPRAIVLPSSGGFLCSGCKRHVARRTGVCGLRTRQSVRSDRHLRALHTALPICRPASTEPATAGHDIQTRVDRACKRQSVGADQPIPSV